MGKKIFFSPIGGTDPIKYQRDGSMLHICRKYLPDVVYLYLSQEMLDNHKKDNRYIDSIERLGLLKNHSFEIHVIERPDLINVQQYDTFYMDFRNIIREIEQTMSDDDELIINMASGTPAMKSALLILATLAEYRFQPIQVSSPLNRQNIVFEERETYDVENNWLNNEDNLDDYKDRCYEVQSMNLLKLLKIDMIKKHIAAYDYPAALSVAKELKDVISEKAFLLLKIADARVKLNRNEISRLNKSFNYKIYPIAAGKEQKLFEYALVLQLKVLKEEYADFIRGITPIVVDILEVILKKECNLTLSDYCKTNSKVLTWDRRKLDRAGLGIILDIAFKNGFKEGPVYSSAIAALIRNKTKNKKLISVVNEMINIEQKVRNVAAHEIVSVTDEWFKKNTGKTAEEILNVIKQLFAYAGIQIEGNYWKSYDILNQDIIKELF